MDYKVTSTPDKKPLPRKLLAGNQLAEILAVFVDGRDSCMSRTRYPVSCGTHSCVAILLVLVSEFAEFTSRFLSFRWVINNVRDGPHRSCRN